MAKKIKNIHNNQSVTNYINDWTNFIYDNTNTKKDIWVETPFGKIKNPKFSYEKSDSDHEINITITYDIWEKNKKIIK